MRSTKLLASLFLLLMALGIPALADVATVPGSAPADWNWPLPAHQWTLGAIPGVATINANTGFSLQIAAAKKIIEKGFAPDISNQVFFEVQAGPFTTTAGSALMYSTHLRWDFVLNSDWTFYALGGLGGSKAGSKLGGDFQLLPRFGIGALLDLERQTHLPMAIRGELSRELVGIGAQFRF